MPRPARSWTSTALGLVIWGMGMSAVWLVLWLTDQVIWQHAFELPGLGAVRLALLGLAAMSLIAGFSFALLRARRGPWVTRTALAGMALGLTLLGLEAVFMFVARSHNVGYTMASGIWFERHWGPANALGYRDGEHERAAGKKLVFLVGDSFTAGGGIARRADRFGDILQRLRPDLQVCNLGASGADTVQEFANLQAHPLQPDALVLQYYVNDVDGAAARCGHRLPAFTAYEDLPMVRLRFLVRGSYLANYVYWLFGHTDQKGYADYFDRAVADERVIAGHLSDLGRFVDHAEQRHVPLVVVVFPALLDPDSSRPLIEPVEAFFRGRGVTVISVESLIGGLPLAERVANRQDAHASPRVHALVAEALARALTDL